VLEFTTLELSKGEAEYVLATTTGLLLEDTSTKLVLVTITLVAFIPLGGLTGLNTDKDVLS